MLADLVAASLSEGGASPEAFAALAAAPRHVTLQVSAAGRSERPPTGYSQAIPGTMVMFTMLVLLTSGAILLVFEREQGLLRRLASTPIRPASIVAGKWMARMALGLVQLAFGMLAGSLLFRMEWGASLWMVGATLVAWAGFNASLGLLLANLARSQAQMLGIGVLGTMGLAALGGMLVADRDHPGVDAVARRLPPHRLDDGRAAQARQLRVRTGRRRAPPRRPVRRHPPLRCRGGTHFPLPVAPHIRGPAGPRRRHGDLHRPAFSDDRNGDSCHRREKPPGPGTNQAWPGASRSRPAASARVRISASTFGHVGWQRRSSEMGAVPMRSMYDS